MYLYCFRIEIGWKWELFVSKQTSCHFTVGKIEIPNKSIKCSLIRSMDPYNPVLFVLEHHWPVTNQNNDNGVSALNLYLKGDQRVLDIWGRIKHWVHSLYLLSNKLIKIDLHFEIMIWMTRSKLCKKIAIRWNREKRVSEWMDCLSWANKSHLFSSSGHSKSWVSGSAMACVYKTITTRLKEITSFSKYFVF